MCEETFFVREGKRGGSGRVGDVPNYPSLTLYNDLKLLPAPPEEYIYRQNLPPRDLRTYAFNGCIYSAQYFFIVNDSIELAHLMARFLEQYQVLCVKGVV